MQNKSKNDETSRGVVISHAYPVIKILESFDDVDTKEAHKAATHTYVSLISHVGMCCILSIGRVNVVENFSNFYQSIRMRYHDISTSFVIFRNSLHFFRIKKPTACKLYALPREHVYRNLMKPPAFGLNIHSGSRITFFESLKYVFGCTCSSNLHFPEKINKIK